MPTSVWSTGCWRRRLMESGGDGTGSTSPAMPTPTAPSPPTAPRPEAWRYRDYVIQAFNRDMPFDRFLTEQLAGDELSDWRGPSR